MNGEAVEAEATFLGNPYSLGPVVWYDAHDIDGDWVNDPTPPTAVSLWKDKSGNSHHAMTTGTAPALDSLGGPSGKPTVEIVSGRFLEVNATFFAKDHYYVFRSPASSWDGYGAVLGHNESINDRNSNYITQHLGTNFHANETPSAVYKNGLFASGTNFDLSPIDQFMVLRLTVNDNDPGPYSSYQIGYHRNYRQAWIFVRFLPLISNSTMKMPIKWRHTLPANGD